VALKRERPFWVRPLIFVAALGAMLPAVTGALLMVHLRPSSFCHPGVEITINEALREAKIRRLHDRESLAVAACVALALAFGGSVGLTLRRRRNRWIVGALAAVALGGYLAADLSGKKEPWHVLSPGIVGWAKIPVPTAANQGPLGISMTHPECDDRVVGLLRRRVTQVYWIHVATGSALALATLALAALGMAWRPPAE